MISGGVCHQSLPVDQGNAEDVFGLKTQSLVDLGIEPGIMIGIVDYQRCLILENPAGNPVIMRDADFVFLHAGCYERPQPV
jgi:hypothetical protein